MVGEVEYGQRRPWEATLCEDIQVRGVSWSQVEAIVYVASHYHFWLRLLAKPAAY